MDPNKPKRVMQADTRRLGEHLPLNRQTRPDLFRDAEEQRQVAADTRARFDRMEASSRADLARIQEAERWENGPPSEEVDVNYLCQRPLCVLANAFVYSSKNLMMRLTKTTWKSQGVR